LAIFVFRTKCVERIISLLLLTLYLSCLSVECTSG